MLEFLNIKPVSKAATVTSQGERPSQARPARDDSNREFDKEYAAARERERQTGAGAEKRTAEAEHGAGPKASDRAKASETSTEDDAEAASAAEWDEDETDAQPIPAPVEETAPPVLRNAADGSEPEIIAGAEEMATATVDAAAPEAGPASAAGGRTSDAQTPETAAQGLQNKGQVRKTAAPSTAETVFLSRTSAGADATPELAKAGADVEPATARPSVPEDRAQTAQAEPRGNDRASQARSLNGAAPGALVPEQATDGAESVGTGDADELSFREARQPSEASRAAQPVAVPPATTQAGLTLAQATLRQEATKDAARDKLELVSVVSVEPEVWGSQDLRTTQVSAGAGLAQILARAETPAMIGRQMAEVLQKLPDRPVEIALNPKELGRVRMSISAAEAGITVTVLAERPETLDLMRRNIEQLAREFQAIGYENISFAFSGGEARHGSSESSQDGGGTAISQLELDAEDPTVPPQDLPQTATSGLDIRL